MGLSIKYLHLDGGRGGSAKSVLTRMGGGGGSSVHYDFFLHVHYKIEIKYGLFRQPKLLSILISPVQLESTTSIPRALFGILIQHFLIALHSSFFIL